MGQTESLDRAGGGGATKETNSLSAGGMGSGLSIGLMSMGVPLGGVAFGHADKEPYPGCFKGMCVKCESDKHVCKVCE